MLTKEEHTPEALKKLKEVLRENKSVKLLMPEVIKLEYYKIIDSAFTEKIKDKGEEIKDKIKDIIPEHLEEKQEPICRKVDEIVFEREKSKDKAKSLFNEMINLKNTEVIELTNKVLLESEKRRIKGLMPTEGKHKNDQDSYIVETLKLYLENSSEKAELIFCSNDINNFTDEVEENNSKNENEKVKLHPDIRKTFEKIDVKINYYRSLPNMLEEEFQKDISYREKEAIEKVKEEEEKIREMKNLIKKLQDRKYDLSIKTKELKQKREDSMNEMKGKDFFASDKHTISMKIGEKISHIENEIEEIEEKLSNLYKRLNESEIR